MTLIPSVFSTPVIFSILNLVITTAQVIGGLISGSLALLSDALHNFSDVLQTPFFAKLHLDGISFDQYNNDVFKNVLLEFLQKSKHRAIKMWF